MNQEDKTRISGGMWLILVLLCILVIVLLWRPGLPTRHDSIRDRQRTRLLAIDAALELFKHEFDGYPPSDANDPTGAPYGGAMRLCEAMLGQDMLGFHTDSVFRGDGRGASGERLYSLSPGEPAYQDNLKARKGPLLPLDTADVCRVAQIYGAHIGTFSPDSRVLCDTFAKKLATGVKAGMPILYYRADPNGTLHDANDPDNPANIYDYRDNQVLLELGVPGEPNTRHPLADPKVFYEVTRSMKITAKPVPRHPDTYILISAGKDGLYGTKDDIMNFRRE